MLSCLISQLYGPDQQVLLPAAYHCCRARVRILGASSRASTEGISRVRHRRLRSTNGRNGCNGTSFCDALARTSGDPGRHTKATALGTRWPQACSRLQQQWEVRTSELRPMIAPVVATATKRKRAASGEAARWKSRGRKRWLKPWALSSRLRLPQLPRESLWLCGPWRTSWSSTSYNPDRRL